MMEGGEQYWLGRSLYVAYSCKLEFSQVGFFSWIFILYADRDLQGTGIVRRKLRETLKE